jgi:nucleoside-diphosphate-sugar epimerase
MRYVNAVIVLNRSKGEVAMRVFLTGASGFIGSAIIPELIAAGHQVLGLARSDASAKSVVAAGAQVHRGDLEDLSSLRSGAAMSDGVIHCAFNHDFSKYAANCEADRHAIEALGSALVGSDRPLVVTSGTGVLGAPGRPATEDDAPISSSGGMPRSASEEAAAAMASRGVRASVVRLPQVHDRAKFGLISPMIAVAREKKVSAYVGDGRNRFAAIHLFDTAPLYRLALEKGVAGARYHAVGEEGVMFRDVAEVIGRRLKLPVVAKSPAEAADHFGWLGFFLGFDCPASNALTQQLLGWHPNPSHPGLIADLDRAYEFDSK